MRLFILLSSSLRASFPVFNFWLLAICYFNWTSIFFFSFLHASKLFSAESSYFLNYTVSCPIYLSRLSFSCSNSSTRSSTLSMCNFSCYCTRICFLTSASRSYISFSYTSGHWGWLSSPRLDLDCVTLFWYMLSSY